MVVSGRCSRTDSIQEMSFLANRNQMTLPYSSEGLVKVTGCLRDVIIMKYKGSPKLKKLSSDLTKNQFDMRILV